MSFEYVIDSSAWIEYYIGEDTNLKILIETKNIATPSVVIAELSDKFARESEDFSGFFQFINARSKIIDLTAPIALESGKFKLKMREKYKQFSLMDSIIYLTSKLHNAVLLSRDQHFKELDNVKFIA